jgi:hypothetical protein
MMTWLRLLLLLLLRHDRECDRNRNHTRTLVLVLDLPRVADKGEVAPPEEGDDHKTKQNYRNRLVVDARPSRRV